MMTDVRELHQYIKALKSEVKVWQDNHERIEDKAEELRVLLKEATDAYEGCAIHIEPPKPHHSGCIVCNRIARARSVLKETK